MQTLSEKVKKKSIECKIAKLEKGDDLEAYKGKWTVLLIYKGTSHLCRVNWDTEAEAVYQINDFKERTKNKTFGNFRSTSGDIKFLVKDGSLMPIPVKE